MFQAARYSPAPLPERITKNVPWRAVDVNRPVTSLMSPCCDVGRAGTYRYRGMTSTARLVAVLKRTLTPLGVSPMAGFRTEGVGAVE
jgi:hypothetical protein